MAAPIGAIQAESQRAAATAQPLCSWRFFWSGAENYATLKFHAKSSLGTTGGGALLHYRRPHLIVRNSQFLKLLTLFPASFRLFKKLRATRAREFPFLLTDGVTYTELPTCICITTRADTARIEAELERLIGIEEARNANVPGLTSTRNKARSRVSVLIKSQHPLDVDADLSALVVTELALEFPSI